MTTREPEVRQEPVRRADPAGNERLTAMTGTVLLVLFVAECITLLNIGNLLTLHVFLGMLLLGPVSLKICSTLWRFTRYYTASAAYVRKGPPAPLQRVTGPFIILTTVAVLGTRIMLAVQGPGNGSWGRLAVNLSARGAGLFPGQAAAHRSRPPHPSRTRPVLSVMRKLPGKIGLSGMIRATRVCHLTWRSLAACPVAAGTGAWAGRECTPRRPGCPARPSRHIFAVDPASAVVCGTWGCPDRPRKTNQPRKFPHRGK